MAFSWAATVVAFCFKRARDQVSVGHAGNVESLFHINLSSTLSSLAHYYEIWSPGYVLQ